MADKNYLEIARAKVTRPATTKSYRKILVYGRNKKGKTNFSLSAGVENTLLIDPEHGTDTMVAKNPFVWHMEEWEDLQEAYGALRTGKLTPNHLKQGESSTPFSWVSLDGTTKMNNYALRFVMKIAEEKDLDRQPGFVDRRDYGKSGELMKQMIINFQSLKMNVCYTAQERMMTTGSFDDDESDDDVVYYVPDLPASVRAYINAHVEVIGRIYTVKVPRGDTDVIQRRLQIGLHEKFDTGYRSDFQLPDMMKNPTLPKLVKLMTTGEQ